MQQSTGETHPIGMGGQDAADRALFEGEVRRLIAAADAARVTLRLLGSLAFQFHCSVHGGLQAALGRAYTDIDLAGYGRETRQVSALMAGLGYTEDREMLLLTEGGRGIFENPANGLHVDVFYDKLDFCHVIRWDNRLAVDSLTLPLAELLLEKTQIVEINEKDIIDTIMLLLEHPLGPDDRETINLARVAQLCAADWGLWRTTTMNLDKVRRLSQNYLQLTADQKAKVVAQVEMALAGIAAEPKPIAFRVRARVGDRVKWYKEVEEVK